MRNFVRIQLVGTALLGLCALLVGTAAGQRLPFAIKPLPPPPAKIVPPAPQPVPPPEPAPAQQDVEDQQVQDVQPAQPIRGLTLLLNTPVHLQGGASAGRVADFILTENGSVAYVLIFHNNRLLLVPYSAAQVNWEQKTVTLNVNLDRLNQAPTFAQNQWAEILAPQSQYMHQMQSFWGAQK